MMLINGKVPEQTEEDKIFNTPVPVTIDREILSRWDRLKIFFGLEKKVLRLFVRPMQTKTIKLFIDAVNALPKGVIDERQDNFNDIDSFSKELCYAIGIAICGSKPSNRLVNILHTELNREQKFKLLNIAVDKIGLLYFARMQLVLKGLLNNYNNN